MVMDDDLDYYDDWRERLADERYEDGIAWAIEEIERKEDEKAKRLRDTQAHHPLAPQAGAEVP